MSNLGIKMEFGTAYLPQLIQANEINHYSYDVIMYKVLEKRQEYGDRIEDILDKVKVAYRKAIRMIKDQAENEEDMINKINNLDNQVQDALLTEDEKAVLNVIRTQVDRLPYRNIRMLM